MTLPHWIDRASLRNFHQDGALVRIALEIEAAEHPDMLLVLVAGIDRVSHALWGKLEPPEAYPPGLRPNDAERAGGATALRRYYEYTDALIGVLVARYGPDDLVLVVSDHGFEAGNEFASLTGVHKSGRALDGVIFVRGRGIPAGKPAEGVGIYDVTPTILAWLGLPSARDMDGASIPFVPAAAEPIDTYDTTPVERVATAPSGADAELIEQLRQLGYIQ